MDKIDQNGLSGTGVSNYANSSTVTVTVKVTDDYEWGKIPDEILDSPNLEELVKDYFVWREPFENTPLLVWCRKTETREYSTDGKVLNVSSQLITVKISDMPMAIVN